MEREHYTVPQPEPDLCPPRDPDGRHRGVPRHEQARDPRARDIPRQIQSDNIVSEQQQHKW